MTSGEAAYLEVHHIVDDYLWDTRAGEITPLNIWYRYRYLKVSRIGRIPATGAADDWTEPPGEMVRECIDRLNGGLIIWIPADDVSLARISSWNYRHREFVHEREAEEADIMTDPSVRLQRDLACRPCTSKRKPLRRVSRVRMGAELGALVHCVQRRREEPRGPLVWREPDPIPIDTVSVLWVLGGIREGCRGLEDLLRHERREELRRWRHEA